MKNYVFYSGNLIESKIEKHEFATNNSGEGLFEWFGGELKQHSGNCQFYASNDDEMLRKINRIYGNEYLRFYKTEKGAKKFIK